MYDMFLRIVLLVIVLLLAYLAFDVWDLRKR